MARAEQGHQEQAVRAARSPEVDGEALAELEARSGPRCGECGDPLRYFEQWTHTDCGQLQGELPMEER